VSQSSIEPEGLDDWRLLQEVLEQRDREWWSEEADQEQDEG
jgi:hypothetical protein